MIGRAARFAALLTLALFALASGGLAHDGTCQLEGTVSDPGGGVVEGATVILEPDGFSTLTNAEGVYCFPELPTGVKRLSIIGDARGSATSEPFELVSKEAHVHVDLTLDPSIVENVVVTGTRTPRRLAEVPVRVEVIERDAIKAVESRTLADAVELTPGVRVENNCQNCSFTQVRLLGLEGAYSQVLIDGQPLMSGLAAVYGLEHIPTALIERLEVVKGGGSSLYGSGSVAGVINVIPRDPKRRGGGVNLRQEWTEGTPSQSFEGGYEWVSHDTRTGFIAFAQRDEIRPIDLSGDGYSEIGLSELEAIGGRFVHRTRSKASRFTVDLSRITEERRGGNRFGFPVEEADVAEAADTVRESVALGWDYRKSRHFDARFVVAHTYTSRDTYYGAGRDPNAFGESKNPLTVVDMQFNHHLERQTITWGAQLSNDHLEDNQPRYDRFFDETYRNVGVFAQSDWKVSDKTELILGVRADDFSEVDNIIVSPRVAMRYAPSAGWNLRASIASGFRGPQVFNEDLHITAVGGEGAVVRNEEGLVEESSLSLMTGIEWLPMWSGGEGRVEANLFYTELEDIFLIEETDDPSTVGQLEFTRINGGAAAVYGVEFGGSFALGSAVSLDAGVVLQRARLDEPDPDFGSRNIARTPEVYGRVGIIYRGFGFADLLATARYTGTMEVPHFAGFIPEDRLENSPSFLTLDLGVSRSFPLSTARGLQMRVSAGVRNVTDEFQEDLDQGMDRDAGYFYGPRIPRQFYVGVGLDF